MKRASSWWPFSFLLHSSYRSLLIVSIWSTSVERSLSPRRAVLMALVNALVLANVILTGDLLVTTKCRRSAALVAAARCRPAVGGD
jgi:hypothetical protein